jgi:hypothetical protein
MSQFVPLRLEQFKGLTDQSTLEFTVQVVGVYGAGLDPTF